MNKVERKPWHLLTNRERADFVTRYNEGQRGGATLNCEGQDPDVLERINQLAPFTLDLLPAGRDLYLMIVPDRKDIESWIAPNITLVSRDIYPSENPLDAETLATYLARAMLTDMRLPVGATTIELLGTDTQQITVSLAYSGRFIITVEDPEREDPTERLRRLDAAAANLRAQLGFSRPGEVIFKEEQGLDRSLLVRADGYGKATIEVVEGDGENSNVHGSLRFRTEAAALAQAEQLATAAGDETDLDEIESEDVERD
jgi:hypothetical protein